MPFLSTGADPNVNYHGKTLPKDKAPARVFTTDPNVNYNGLVLPAQRTQVKTPVLDETNNPSLVIINGITLPGDVHISFPDKNIIVQTQILDGVSVFERINRAPVEIELEFTLRMQEINGTQYNGVTPPQGLALSGIPQNIFPQSYLEDVWNNIFLPRSVLTIQNTMLNGLGISQVVVESFHPYTVKGSTNLPCRLRCYENVYGLPINMKTRDESSYNGII